MLKRVSSESELAWFLMVYPGTWCCPQWRHLPWGAVPCICGSIAPGVAPCRKERRKGLWFSGATLQGISLSNDQIPRCFSLIHGFLCKPSTTSCWLTAFISTTVTSALQNGITHVGAWLIWGESVLSPSVALAPHPFLRKCGKRGT